MQNETVIAGFGGQGVLFAGKVLSYAALVNDMEVTWFPSYGPEMRGGTANCTIVISDEEVEWSGNEFRSVMVIQVAYSSKGVIPLKIPNLQDKGDQYALWWQGPSPAKYEMVLSASKNIPEEELFKVKNSMQY